MNAQSNHPIRTSQTRTTDPQFLGPEAGQQAEGMAEGKAGGNAGDVQAHELGDMRTILHIALTQPGVMNQAYQALKLAIGASGRPLSSSCSAASS